MGILTASAIREEMRKGNIVIEPWIESHVQPNSYDVRLDNLLLVYDRQGQEPLDMRRELATRSIQIPEDGLVLEPGKLYLGKTVEYIEVPGSPIPMLSGRSSLGRLGIFIHVTAGVIDVGWKGSITLELTCVEPVRVYAGARVGQFYYLCAEGEADEQYEGKYSNPPGHKEPIASRIWQDDSD